MLCSSCHHGEKRRRNSTGVEYFGCSKRLPKPLDGDCISYQDISKPKVDRRVVDPKDICTGCKFRPSGVDPKCKIGLYKTPENTCSYFFSKRANSDFKELAEKEIENMGRKACAECYYGVIFVTLGIPACNYLEIVGKPRPCAPAIIIGGRCECFKEGAPTANHETTGPYQFEQREVLRFIFNTKLY